jgi:hypothetical protein
MWLTLVGLAVVALAVSAGVLRGEDNALRPKQNVAPTLLAPSASTSAAGKTTAAGGASSAADPTISVGAPITPASIDLDVRNLPVVPANPLPQTPEYEPLPTKDQGPQPGPVPSIPAQAPDMPATIQNFDGMTHDLNGSGWPPDTNGDVGASFYIEAVNTSIGIYNKNGTPAAAPFTFTSLWSGAGTGTPCDTVHHGDPTVVYDPMGARFFVGDFSWTNIGSGPYYECIAVSKTANPVVGGWWLYAIPASDAGHPWLNDYPKMGIWPDGLYVTYNMFDCDATCSPGGSPFVEVRAQALSRTAMEAGSAAPPINADLNSTSYFTLAPSTMRNDTPPAGRENLLVSESQISFDWEVWKFHADFVTPGLSTFTGPTNVSQTSYTIAPPTVATPGNLLDTLRERVMVQNQYTDIAGAESLWVNHTVRTGLSPAPAGIQWAQINVTGGIVAAAPVQQQIYGNVGNDGLHRWMGSLAVDKAGNLALGYSAANSSSHPSIRYNGRLAGDVAGTLPQGEAILFSGTASQTNNCGAGACIRWGDYSGMTLDPDGCTFWYTNEYYLSGAAVGDWHTRIGSFTFAPNNCTTTPTVVSIARFAAVRTKKGVAASWRTSSETQVAGFNVWRQGGVGRWTKLNAKLIPAKHAGQARGATYRYVDRIAARRSPYNYRLQVVAPSGKRAWYGLSAVQATR